MSATVANLIPRILIFVFLSALAASCGTDPAPVFSFTGDASEHPRQVSCHITHTNERTHDIIREGLHRSPMYSGVIDFEPGDTRNLGELVEPPVPVDLDGLDPSVLPGTGTPEPGGLSYRQLLGLLAGTWLNWRLTASRLRTATEATQETA